MRGVSKQQAREAIEAGWNPSLLATLNRLVIEAGNYWVRWLGGANRAFVVCDQDYDLCVIYRNISPTDLATAFADSGPHLAYADGSGSTGDKPAGVGVVLYSDGYTGHQRIFAQNIGLGTNNRAELCAVWCALRAVPRLASSILIRTDSEYAIGALTKDWARNANVDLIEAIRTDLDLRREVRLEHVDGHSGHEGNEVADQLANIGRKLVTAVTDYE